MITNPECSACGKPGLPAEDDTGQPACMHCGALRPEVRERQREYRKRPEVKARRREYQREYRKRPEVKARRREHQREYRKRTGARKDTTV